MEVRTVTLPVSIKVYDETIRLYAHGRKLLRDDLPVVLAGDYNVAPTEIDIYPTSSWDDDALVQPESRAEYARLVRQGWTDAIRELHGRERVYTFWHYLRHRWQRNAGLRLDHLLLSPALALRLEDAGVDRFVRGQAGASAGLDHAPTGPVEEETQGCAMIRRAQRLASSSNIAA